MFVNRSSTQRLRFATACSPSSRPRRLRRLDREMSSEPISQPREGESLESPVAELLRRARPLPPHEEMVIDDLTEEEGTAFLAALEP